MTMIGRRCRFQHPEDDPGNVSYGTIADETDREYMIISGEEELALPKKKVTVADEKGRFASSIRATCDGYKSSRKEPQ